VVVDRIAENKYVVEVNNNKAVFVVSKCVSLDVESGWGRRLWLGLYAGGLAPCPLNEMK
jgi:hypothetical protein